MVAAMAKKQKPLVTPTSIIEDRGGCVAFARIIGLDETGRRGERRVNNWKREGIPPGLWGDIIDATAKTEAPITFEMLREADQNLKARVA